MATNKYVNTNQQAGNKDMPGGAYPGELLVLHGTYEKTAADTDLSVLRLGTVPAGAIPVPVLSTLANDAIAGFTSVNLGLYKRTQNGVTGAVVSSNVLLSAADLHLLNAGTNPFAALNIDQYGSTLRTLAAGSIGDGNEQYDVALNGATLGANTGTISWTLTFLVPQA